MNFLKQFFSKSVRKQFFFVLALFAIIIPSAILDSNAQLKVDFYADEFNVASDRYTMTVRYDQITSAELAELADAGEKVQDSYDDDIIRTGTWENDTWGIYSINVDLDASNCVKITLTDGRIFVFSCKNNAKTEELYNTLMAKLHDA